MRFLVAGLEKTKGATATAGVAKTYKNHRQTAPANAIPAVNVVSQIENGPEEPVIKTFRLSKSSNSPGM